MGSIPHTRLTVEPVGIEIYLAILTKSPWPLGCQCPEWSVISLPDRDITVIGIAALATGFASRFERLKIHIVTATG